MKEKKEGRKKKDLILILKNEPLCRFKRFVEAYCEFEHKCQFYKKAISSTLTHSFLSQAYNFSGLAYDNSSNKPSYTYLVNANVIKNLFFLVH